MFHIILIYKRKIQKLANYQKGQMFTILYYYVNDLDIYTQTLFIDLQGRSFGFDFDLWYWNCTTIFFFQSLIKKETFFYDAFKTTLCQYPMDGFKEASQT